MKISILFLIACVCFASAKYIARNQGYANYLSRYKRSALGDPSTIEHSGTESDESNDEGSGETKQLQGKVSENDEYSNQKLLTKLDKERLKQEENERKLEEKRAKAERKQQEIREKEQRKQLEKAEKEKRKAEAKLKKAEMKREKAIQKQLKKLQNELLQENEEGLLETEEENSVELGDIWRNQIYTKYGLNLESTRLEKKAALNKYMEEELKLNSNSTNSERRQAIINLIDTNLNAGPPALDLIRKQLLSHLTSAAIEKIRTNLDTDIEGLNNKTALLSYSSMPWALQAKNELEEKKALLLAVTKLLSNILPDQQQNTSESNNTNNENVTNGESGIETSTLPSENNSGTTIASKVSTDENSPNETTNTKLSSSDRTSEDNITPNIIPVLSNVGEGTEVSVPNEPNDTNIVTENDVRESITTEKGDNLGSTLESSDTTKLPPTSNGNLEDNDSDPNSLPSDPENISTISPSNVVNNVTEDNVIGTSQSNNLSDVEDITETTAQNNKEIVTISSPDIVNDANESNSTNDEQNVTNILDVSTTELTTDENSKSLDSEIAVTEPVISESSTDSDIITEDPVSEKIGQNTTVKKVNTDVTSIPHIPTSEINESEAQDSQSNTTVISNQSTTSVSLETQTSSQPSIIEENTINQDNLETKESNVVTIPVEPGATIIEITEE